jgi:sigma-B regulation protein RsbU (phosphoserine phosphatase)
MKGVQRKVLRLCLSLSLGAVLLLGLLCLIGLWSLRQAVEGQHMHMGDQAAEKSRTALEEIAETNLAIQAKDRAALIDERLQSVTDETRMIAGQASYIFTHPDEFRPRAIDFLNEQGGDKSKAYMMLSPSVQNSQAALDEAYLAANIEDLLRELSKAGTGVSTAYISLESGASIVVDTIAPGQTFRYFDFRERPWYTAAKVAGGLVWTAVFEDALGRGPTVSCAMPFYDTSGPEPVFKGVAGCGLIITSALGDIIGNDGPPSLILDNRGMMLAGDSSVLNPDMINYRQPLKTINWTYIAGASYNEIITPALDMQETILDIRNAEMEETNRIMFIFFLIYSISIVLAAAIDFGIARTWSKKMVQPIVQLTKGARIVGSGELNYRFSIKTGDEVEELSGVINNMLNNIARISAEREQVRNELALASQLQQAMLPDVHQMVDNPFISLAARMEAVQEVGGDFYDCFYQDASKTKMTLVIADVSGKGAAAALFMAISKTLLKYLLMKNDSPADALDQFNQVISMDNPQCMFVTVFVMTLDLLSGEMVYANAGHNRPLFASSGLSFQYLQLADGIPAGLFQTSQYRLCSMRLKAGDKLYLYTDGFTETTNPAMECWGDERFLEAANACRLLSPEEADAALRQAREQYAAGEPRSDDITSLALEYRAVEDFVLSDELYLPAQNDKLEMLQAWVQGTLEAQNCAPGLLNRIAVVSEEIFVNIVSYAQATEVSLRKGFYEKVMVLEFEDDGIPFNPLEKTANTDLLSDHGRGISLIRAWTDGLFYKRREESGLNVLTALIRF